MFSNDNVLSAWYKVYLNNKEISFERELCVTSISISETIAGSDTLTISISDPELVYIQDNIYKENVPIRVEIGFNEDTYVHTFDGYISALDIDFPESGIPTVTLTCLDQTHRMNRIKKTRSWENTTSAKVVEAIAKEYGFAYIIEKGYTFKVEESISQSDQTDIEFIESLAGDEVELFMCKLIGRTIYYIKKGVLSNPVYEATYREYPYDLISFSPSINIEQKTEKTEKKDVDKDKNIDSSSVASSGVGSFDKSTSASPTSQNPTKDSSGYNYDWKGNSWSSAQQRATNPIASNPDLQSKINSRLYADTNKIGPDKSDSNIKSLKEQATKAFNIKPKSEGSIII